MEDCKAHGVLPAHANKISPLCEHAGARAMGFTDGKSGAGWSGTTYADMARAIWDYDQIVAETIGDLTMMCGHTDLIKYIKVVKDSDYPSSNSIYVWLIRHFDPGFWTDKEKEKLTAVGATGLFKSKFKDRSISDSAGNAKLGERCTDKSSDYGWCNQCQCNGEPVCNSMRQFCENWKVDSVCVSEVPAHKERRGSWCKCCFVMEEVCRNAPGGDQKDPTVCAQRAKSFRQFVELYDPSKFTNWDSHHSIGHADATGTKVGFTANAPLGCSCYWGAPAPSGGKKWGCVAGSQYRWVENTASPTSPGDRWKGPDPYNEPAIPGGQGI